MSIFFKQKGIYITYRDIMNVYYPLEYVLLSFHFVSNSIFAQELVCSKGFKSSEFTEAQKKSMDKHR